MDKTYPIYRFSIYWSELADPAREYSEAWIVGLKAGRIWNSTSFTRMFREDQDLKVLEEWAMTWWDEYKMQSKNTEKDMLLFQLKVEFVEYETWHLTWFQHETFDRAV